MDCSLLWEELSSNDFSPQWCSNQFLSLLSVKQFCGKAICM